MGSLGRKPSLVETARLTAHRDMRGNDVGRHAAADHPNVCGGFRIDPSEMHARNRLRRHNNRAYTLFGRNTCMRRLSRDLYRHGVLRRGSRNDRSNRPRAIHHDCRLGGELCEVKVLGTDQADLFLHAEYNLNRAA